MGTQKWMVENGYRNLIQGKQPDWAKNGKSFIGIAYAGGKWIIKDLLKKPWKGVKGATPVAVLINIIDLGMTLHKEYGDHAGATIPLQLKRK